MNVAEEPQPGEVAARALFANLYGEEQEDPFHELFYLELMKELVGAHTSSDADCHQPGSPVREPDVEMVARPDSPADSEISFDYI